MTFLSRVTSLVLWGLAVGALAITVAAAYSATEAVRFSTISDNSSAPQAFAGALEVSVRTPSQELQVGDTVLVGAHSAKGSTLGVIVAEDGSGENKSVTLKGSNKATPDVWSYELGKTSYKHLFSIPLLGGIYSLAGGVLNPWVFAFAMAFIAWFGLFTLRRSCFANEERTEDRWFKKLPADTESGVDAMLELFQAKGLEAPRVYSRKKR